MMLHVIISYCNHVTLIYQSNLFHLHGMFQYKHPSLQLSSTSFVTLNQTRNTDCLDLYKTIIITLDSHTLISLFTCFSHFSLLTTSCPYHRSYYSFPSSVLSVMLYRTHSVVSWWWVWYWGRYVMFYGCFPPAFEISSSFSVQIKWLSLHMNYTLLFISHDKVIFFARH